MASLARRSETWNVDVDRYINRVVPASPLYRLPTPVSRFLGYRREQREDVGNVLGAVWSLVGAFCGLAVIAAVFNNTGAIQMHNPPALIASFVSCFFVLRHSRVWGVVKLHGTISRSYIITSSNTRWFIGLWYRLNTIHIIDLRPMLCRQADSDRAHRQSWNTMPSAPPLANHAMPSSAIPSQPSSASQSQSSSCTTRNSKRYDGSQAPYPAGLPLP